MICSYVEWYIKPELNHCPLAVKLPPVCWLICNNWCIAMHQFRHVFSASCGVCSSVLPLQFDWRAFIHTSSTFLSVALASKFCGNYFLSYVAVFKYEHHRNRFMALFRDHPAWAGARRELLDFMVQEKINRGRHTNHPAGRHFIRTKQCPPPLSLHFLQAGCPSCHPTNSVKALKATSAFGLGRR